MNVRRSTRAAFVPLTHTPVAAGADLGDTQVAVKEQQARFGASVYRTPKTY